MGTAVRHSDANTGLGSWPARRARISPDRTARVEGERTLTYAQPADRTARLAGAPGPARRQTNPAEGYLMESLMAAVASGSTEAKERMRAFLDGRAGKAGRS